MTTSFFTEHPGGQHLLESLRRVLELGGPVAVIQTVEAACAFLHEQCLGDEMNALIEEYRRELLAAVGIFEVTGDEAAKLLALARAHMPALIHPEPN